MKLETDLSFYRHLNDKNKKGFGFCITDWWSLLISLFLFLIKY